MGMLLKLECQYLQGTVPRFGSLMGHIKYVLIEAFLPALFKVEEVSADLRKSLGHSIKRKGLFIP